MAKKFKPTSNNTYSFNSGKCLQSKDGKWRRCYVCKKWKPMDDKNFWRTLKQNHLTDYCQECRRDPKLRKDTYIPKPPRPKTEKKPLRYTILGATNKVQIEKTERDKVAAYFNWNCAYCGCSLIEDYRGFVLEHYRPVSRGGESTYTNLLPSCNHCNNSKNWTEPEIWLIRHFGEETAKEVLERINQFFSIAHTVYSFYEKSAVEVSDSSTDLDLAR